MKIVTCIGDSETWCLNLARNEAWPYKLCQALDGGGTPTLDTLSPWSGAISTNGSQREHVGTNWTVRNAGVSSDTSRGGRSRWATDVMGPSVKPHFVLIMFGENDLYYADSDATFGLDYTPGGLIDNIEWMVAQCRANGIIPIVCSPTPHGTLEQAAGRWAGMQSLLKWLGTSMTWMSTSHAARSPALPLVDCYRLNYDGPSHPAYPQNYPSGTVTSLDLIHPNATGAQNIATEAAAVVLANAPVAVGRSLSQTYVTRMPTARPFGMPWAVDGVGASCAIPYEVKLVTDVGRSLTQTYEVLPVVGRSIGQSHRVAGYAAASLVQRYAVPQISTSYATDRRLGPPQVTYQTLRVIQVGASVTVGTSLVQNYITAPKVATSLLQIYATYSPIPGLATCGMQYKVIQAVGRSANQAYYINTTASRPFDQNYTVKNTATLALVLSYLIRGLWTGNYGVFIEPDYKYMIASQKENEIILFINPISTL